MPKTCAFEGCQHNVFSKNHCLWHQYIVNPRKPIARTTSKTAKNNRAYLVLNREFLKENPKCGAKLKGCLVWSSEVHHKKGRGIYLLAVWTWLAVCQYCHDIITNKMSLDEAVQLGLRIKRN
jgi:hypothetical protein